MIASTLICVFIQFIITIKVSSFFGGRLDVEDQGHFVVTPSNIIDQWKWVQNFNISVIQSLNIYLSVNDWIQEEILLNKVDILSKDENGTTFLHIAAIHGKYELIKFFITEVQSGYLNQSTNELQHNHESVHLSNQLSYYINYQDKYLDSPFHKACFNGHENIARLFITHGADIHLPTQGGANALHIAAYQNQVAIVNMLIIDYHIAVDCQTNSGVTALHYAVGQGHQETVNALLLQHKANVNMATITGGATPLHVACQKGNIEMMKLLLIGGTVKADIYVKNMAGLTPLDVYETTAIARFKVKLASAAHQNINHTNTSSDVTLSNVRSDDETKLKLNQTDKVEEERNVNNDDEEILLFMKEIDTIKIEMVELYDDSMTATATSNASNSNNDTTFKTNEL